MLCFDNKPCPLQVVNFVFSKSEQTKRKKKGSWYKRVFCIQVLLSTDDCWLQEAWRTQIGACILLNKTEASFTPDWVLVHVFLQCLQSGLCGGHDLNLIRKAAFYIIGYCWIIAISFGWVCLNLALKFLKSESWRHVSKRDATVSVQLAPSAAIRLSKNA